MNKREINKIKQSKITRNKIKLIKTNHKTYRWLQASKFKGIYKRLNPSGITGIHPDCTDFDVLDSAGVKITEYLVRIITQRKKKET
jgi:hypothetical protein